MSRSTRETKAGQRIAGADAATGRCFPAATRRSWPPSRSLFRALFFWLYHDSPFFHVPVVDAATFNLWAEAIRQHREFLPGVYFKPPLYPHVLAVMYDLFGPRPEPTYVAPGPARRRDQRAGAGPWPSPLLAARRSARRADLRPVAGAAVPRVPARRRAADDVPDHGRAADPRDRRTARAPRGAAGLLARRRGPGTAQPADPGAGAGVVGMAAARSRPSGRRSRCWR